MLPNTKHASGKCTSALHSTQPSSGLLTLISVELYIAPAIYQNTSPQQSCHLVGLSFYCFYCSFLTNSSLKCFDYYQSNRTARKRRNQRDHTDSRYACVFAQAWRRAIARANNVRKQRVTTSPRADGTQEVKDIDFGGQLWTP